MTRFQDDLHRAIRDRDIRLGLDERLRQKLQAAPAPDIGEIWAEIAAVGFDAVARGATGFLVDQPAGRRIARRFFKQPPRPEAFHKRDHPPYVIVADAHGRHLRSRDAIPDRRVQLRIASAMPVDTGGEIGAAASLTERAMTVRTMGLKERFACSNVAIRRKRIGVGNRCCGRGSGQCWILRRLRPQPDRQESRRAQEPKHVAHLSSSVCRMSKGPEYATTQEGSDIRNPSAMARE